MTCVICWVQTILQEILNHCFEDLEKFIARLQQAAEAKSILDQRAKKKSRSTKKGSKESKNWFSITGVIT